MEVQSKPVESRVETKIEYVEKPIDRPVYIDRPIKEIVEVPREIIKEIPIVKEVPVVYEQTPIVNQICKETVYEKEDEGRICDLEH